MKRITILSAITLLLVACVAPTSSDDKKSIFVTIAPLKQLAEEVSCGDFNVKLLVKQGVSPESFEPTAMDIAALNDAEFVFSTGLINFEQSLIRHIDNSSIVNLSQGITTLEGSCSHHHCNHSHGVDPHIWTSPHELRIMVKNMQEALLKAYPDSTKYRSAAERIVARIDSLDAYCARQLSNTDSRAIMIYHPAYTYLAHHYNIEQIAIENEGKEPSPRHLVELVKKGKEMNIKRVFHQPQYSISKLQSIAEELDADIIATDPLALDIEAEIRRVVDLISRSDE